MKPVINKRKCPAQKEMCRVIPACPTQAMAYIEDENEPLGGKIVIDEALCNECGLCVQECCGNAIELV
jgi:NAD-dependent dihydropyrimidine dehydrogenase PreA subunit